MAVGDIMLTRNVAIFQSRRNFLSPVDSIIPVLNGCDFLTGNLESMISDKGYPMEKIYNFRASPKQIELLLGCGFDCLNLANNHAFDYHSPAFLDCIERLDAAQISHVGGGENLVAAEQPYFEDVRGTMIGILGYNDTKTNFYRSDIPCTAPLWGCETIMKRALNNIEKYSGYCDIMLVHVHWGTEDTLYPADRQIDIARKMVDAGADIIIGHHPHRLQGIEFYNNAVIVYSLGNFLFDQNDHVNNIGGILEIKVSEDNICSVSLIPTETLTIPRAVKPAADDLFSYAFALMEEISLLFNIEIENANGKINFNRQK